MQVSRRAMMHVLRAVSDEISAGGSDCVAVSVRKIADRAGYRERLTRYAIHELEAQRFIYVTRVLWGKPSVYQLVQQ